MMRQLGFPSLFISQSAAEAKWPELLQALGELADNKTYNDEEITTMKLANKMQTYKNDSPTVVRYFDHRFQQLLNKVVKSPHKTNTQSCRLLHKIRICKQR